MPAAVSSSRVPRLSVYLYERTQLLFRLSSLFLWASSIFCRPSCVFRFCSGLCPPQPPSPTFSLCSRGRICMWPSCSCFASFAKIRLFPPPSSRQPLLCSPATPSEPPRWASGFDFSSVLSDPPSGCNRRGGTVVPEFENSERLALNPDISLFF